MAYIKVINYEDSEGELKKIYDNIIEKRGRLAEVHKIQSLNPESIAAHIDLYMTIMFGKSPLKRYQREMIAVVVSAANQCDYCVAHHGNALNHFWKDQKKVQQVTKDYAKAGLSEADLLLCQYAFVLTVLPGEIKEEKHTEKLKSAGLDDRAILDAALITSYFNFVNRMILGLGVQLEEDEAEGYKYETNVTNETD